MGEGEYNRDTTTIKRYPLTVQLPNNQRQGVGHEYIGTKEFMYVCPHSTIEITVLQ